MSELSNYQVNYLRHFLVQKYVRYEDVQLELIDHLATAIEEKIKEEPEITFESALGQVYRGFGVGGFARIVKEKEKSMRKFWRKHVWKCFLEFLKPPLVFVGIALYLLFWGIQTQFQIHLWNTTGLIIIFSLIVAILIFSKIYARKNNTDKFLFIRSYNGFVGMTLYFSIFLLPSAVFNFITGESQIAFSNTSIMTSSIYYAVNIILVYILMFKIPNGLLLKMKKQYQNLNIA